MKPDLTTRRGIDAVIMRLRRQLSGLPDDAVGEICIISENLEALREKREALSKPYERVRPIHEAALMSFGVGV